MQRRAFSLQARPPFRLDLTVWALRRRPDNAVDAWDGCTYRRSLRVESGVIELAAVQAGTAAAPRLEVTVAGTQVDRQAEKFARAMVARLLGLEIDLSAFYQLAEGDPFLHTLAARFRGLGARSQPCGRSRAGPSPRAGERRGARARVTPGHGPARGGES